MNPMKTLTQPVVKRRRTKKESEHTTWLMNRWFRFMDIKKEMRRRKHKLPESLISALDNLDSELQAEFNWLIGLDR